MSQSTARHALPFIQPAQAQKHVTHNEALEQLDLLVQLTVEAFDASIPPNMREDGQIWALGLAPSGEWAGQGGRLAAWFSGAWRFVTPHLGWRAAQGTDLRVWSGSDWHAPDLPELQNLEGLGIQTAFDATNRLAVASEATLLTHDGAGHQVKINKNDATHTASLLFQTGWSGRAEMGTAGSDAWSIKVSADGDTWHEALKADPATGQITIPEGLSVSGTLSLPVDSLDLSSAAFAGQLPLTQGGTGAANATDARTNLGLGTAATADVTVSASDMTSNRLLRTGDAGLLTNSAQISTGDLDDVRYGAITAPVNQLNSPRTEAILWSGARTAGARASQLLIDHSSAARAYVRGYNSGRPAGQEWGPWAELYHRLDILGAVSQSAGIPTGAIIQRGSSGNGEFVRFADGTQICTFSIGALSTGDRVWTFPASFTSPARVTATAATSLDAVFASCRPPTTSSVAFNCWNLSGARTTASAGLIAVGRWF